MRTLILKEDGQFWCLENNYCFGPAVWAKVVARGINQTTVQIDDLEYSWCSNTTPQPAVNGYHILSAKGFKRGPWPSLYLVQEGRHFILRRRNAFVADLGVTFEFKCVRQPDRVAVRRRNSGQHQFDLDINCELELGKTYTWPMKTIPVLTARNCTLHLDGKNTGWESQHCRITAINGTEIRLQVDGKDCRMEAPSEVPPLGEYTVSATCGLTFSPPHYRVELCYSAVTGFFFQGRKPFGHAVNIFPEFKYKDHLYFQMADGTKGMYKTDRIVTRFLDWRTLTVNGLTPLSKYSDLCKNGDSFILYQGGYFIDLGCSVVVKGIEPGIISLEHRQYGRHLTAAFDLEINPGQKLYLRLEAGKMHIVDRPSESLIPQLESVVHGTLVQGQLIL